MLTVKDARLMPLISINLDYFLQLGTLPFPALMWRLFLDGGWIPVLVVLIQGFWLLFVQSRQAKYAASLKWTLLAIDIPRGNEQTPKAVEHIFAQISGAHSGIDWYEKHWLGKFTPAFSFELVSVGGYVQFLVHCAAKFRDLVEAAVYSQYPDAEIVEVQDYVDKVPVKFPHPEWDVFGTEFVLKKPHHYPIRTYEQFEHKGAEENIFKDPLSGVLEVLGSLKYGEQLWLQFRIVPTDETWHKKGEEAVNKMVGRKLPIKKSTMDKIMEIPLGAVSELGSAVFASGEAAPPKKEAKPEEQLRMLAMTPGEKRIVEGVQMKLSKTGFNTKIRIIYAGRRDVFNKGRLSGLKGAFSQFGAMDANGFKGYGPVTPKGDYPWQRWSENEKKTAILRNFRNRSSKGAPSYILNIEELATLWHFPSLMVKAPSVKKTDAKRAEPPSRLPTAEMPDTPFPAMKPPAPKPEPGGAPGNLPV